MFFHDCHYYMDEAETLQWNSLSRKLNVPIMFHLSGFQFPAKNIHISLADQEGTYTSMDGKISLDVKGNGEPYQHLLINPHHMKADRDIDLTPQLPREFKLKYTAFYGTHINLVQLNPRNLYHNANLAVLKNRLFNSKPEKFFGDYC